MSAEILNSLRTQKISNNGEITVKAEPGQIIYDRYSVLVAVLDDGSPPREDSAHIDVIFPPLGYTPTTPRSTSKSTTESERVGAASTAPDDSMLTIILGAVAGVLLVVIVILLVYIIWK